MIHKGPFMDLKLIQKRRPYSQELWVPKLPILELFRKYRQTEFLNLCCVTE